MADIKAAAITGYQATESMFQAAYDMVPDKLQLATHSGGAIVGTLAAGAAAKAAIQKGINQADFSKVVSAVKAGDYTTSIIEVGNRTMGLVTAAGITAVVVVAAGANIEAAVRSWSDKAPLLP
ncbi:MAG: hypothetical protein AAB426_14915 [Myxococcota bacterium]